MLPDFAKFVCEQARKTAECPTRMLAVPAQLLLQNDHPALAWACMRPLCEFAHLSTDDSLLAANCLYQGLGRYRDAMALFAGVSKLRALEAEQLGFAHCPFRVLDSVWARHLGHLGLVDYTLKLGILEGRRREDTILYLPPGSRVANRFLLDQLASHLRLIERPADLPFPATAIPALHFDLFCPRLPDQTTDFYWQLAARTYRRWEREGRKPLLRLPSKIEELGRAALKKVGLPHGAWFVALHIREREPSGGKSGLNAARNADISAYYPAVAEVSRRGGWVIRIGDSKMTAAPPHGNFVDYGNSAIRADWMDIFILARCRFLIGTNSGPAFVPALYGTPSLLTNWWPAAERPWHQSDIFIPKILRQISSDRGLTQSETLQEPMASCYSRRHLAHVGVRLEDNDPDVISAAVGEMLDRLDGAVPDAQTVALRTRADSIYEANGIAGAAQLTREFLRRHGDLIG